MLLLTLLKLQAGEIESSCFRFAFFRFGPFFVAPRPVKWSYGECGGYEQNEENKARGSIHRPFIHIQASCEPG
jgi:hypothetical protein